MYTFPSLLKKIREESQLTQSELASALDVSTILISMMETGQKPASKKFIAKLSSRLGVHPNSILPSVFADIPHNSNSLSGLEKSLLDLGSKLQDRLIKTKAKNLHKYAGTK